MKRLIFLISLWVISCQPCPAQEYPEYWKLPFGYIGSYGSVNFPQGRFWFNKDTLQFYGLADSAKYARRADSLGTNPWTAYLRSNANDTATGKIRFEDTTFQATGKPVMFGSVAVKDTSTGRLRIKSVSIDSLWLNDSLTLYRTAGNKRVGKLDSLYARTFIPISGNKISTYGALNAINDTIYAGTIQSVNNIRCGNVLSIGNTAYGGAGVYLAPGGIPYINSSKSKGAVGFGRNDTTGVVIDSISGRWKLAGSQLSGDTLTANKQVLARSSPIRESGIDSLGNRFEKVWTKTKLYKGWIVQVDTGNIMTWAGDTLFVQKAEAGCLAPMGVVYDDSIVANTGGRITTSGTASVAVLNATAYTLTGQDHVFITSATAGLANVDTTGNLGTSVEHFKEIGHPWGKKYGKNVNGDSLAQATLHFN